MSFTLSELAQRLSLEVSGGPSDVAINSVASLLDAQAGDISFCTGRSHLKDLVSTKATAVIIDPTLKGEYTGSALISSNPHLSFVNVIHLFHPRECCSPGIHPSASVHADARVHASVSIGENVVVDAFATIDEGCEVSAGCYIGKHTQIGKNTLIKANVSIQHKTKVGSDCVFQSGCVIGSDGFGHARDGDQWVAVPQLGNVVIGDNVSIGANTSIDRGALGDTIISNRVKIDNLVHIAHNVSIGEDTAIAACVGFAGSTTVGKRCTFAGQVGVVDNIRICDDAHFTGQASVRADVRKPGVYSSGVLLEEHSSWARNAMRFKRLNDLFKQVRDLTKKQTNNE